MDMGAVMAAVSGIAGALGGFMGGRKTATSQAMSIAVGTVDLLQAQVAALVEQGDSKSAQIAELGTRVNVLESLVTQRAEVEELREDVTGVRSVVDRIAVKVGA